MTRSSQFGVAILVLAALLTAGCGQSEAGAVFQALLDRRRRHQAQVRPTRDGLWHAHVVGASPWIRDVAAGWLGRAGPGGLIDGATPLRPGGRAPGRGRTRTDVLATTGARGSMLAVDLGSDRDLPPLMLVLAEDAAGIRPRQLKVLVADQVAGLPGVRGLPVRTDERRNDAASVRFDYTIDDRTSGPSASLEPLSVRWSGVRVSFIAPGSAFDAARSDFEIIAASLRFGIRPGSSSLGGPCGPRRLPAWTREGPSRSWTSSIGRASAASLCRPALRPRSCDYWEDDVRGAEAARPGWWEVSAPAPERSRLPRLSDNPSRHRPAVGHNPFAPTRSPPLFDAFADDPDEVVEPIRPDPAAAPSADPAGEPRKLGLLSGASASSVPTPRSWSRRARRPSTPSSGRSRPIRAPSGSGKALPTAAPDAAPRGHHVHRDCHRRREVVGSPRCSSAPSAMTSLRGFSAIEAYPDLTLPADEASAASPPFWVTCGFEVAADDDRFPVMRRGSSHKPAPDRASFLHSSGGWLVEAVPNLSEGERTEVIERIAAAADGAAGAWLLHRTSDVDPVGPC